MINSHGDVRNVHYLEFPINPKGELKISVAEKFCGRCQEWRAAVGVFGAAVCSACGSSFMVEALPFTAENGDCEPFWGQ